MDDEISSPATNKQAESVSKDFWGFRSSLIAEKAQEMLGGRCKRLQGISIGGNHKIYRVTMEDGRTMIGRVVSSMLAQYGVGMCPEDSMEAEIAAMRYVKTHTSIPVPEVYYHDKDEHGLVGGEWMLLEDVQGTNLSVTWPQLSTDQRRRVALAIVDVWAQLMRLRFDAIGSVKSSGNSFFVGSMTFMPTNIGGTTAPPIQSKCGPFSCARDWLLALARGDLRFQREISPTDEETIRMSSVLTDIDVGPSYLDDKESSNPSLWSINVLFHVDLGLQNIMVDGNDPTTITGVLDWEGACVVPLWSILPMFLYEMVSFTPETEREQLEEIRHHMKRALKEAMPEWAKLVTDGHAARLLHRRAELSGAKPEDVHGPEPFY